MLKSYPPLKAGADHLFSYGVRRFIVDNHMNQSWFERQISLHRLSLSEELSGGNVTWKGTHLQRFKAILVLDNACPNMESKQTIEQAHFMLSAHTQFQGL